MSRSIPTSLDRETRAQRVANTYADGEGWQRAQDYRRVREYMSEHPDAGAQTIASALGVEKSYIHNWVYGGSAPHAVRALDTIDALGWLDCQPGDRTFEALSVLSAWMLAGGGLPKNEWVPSFFTQGRPVELLKDALDAVGAGMQLADRESGTEVRPAAHAGVLARYLVGVLGSPRGQKIHADLRVPNWLAGSPPETRRRWARTIAVVRGGEMTHEPATRIREADRPDAYHDALVALFRDVTDDADAITQGRDAIYIRRDARDVLDVVPELPA